MLDPSNQDQITQAFCHAAEIHRRGAEEYRTLVEDLRVRRLGPRPRAEIIASLVPAIAQGLLASDTDPTSARWRPDVLACKTLDRAEALYVEGVKRGIYPAETARAQGLTASSGP